jgi:hypothetical protein
LSNLHLINHGLYTLTATNGKIDKGEVGHGAFLAHGVEDDGVQLDGIELKAGSSQFSTHMAQ